MNVELHIERLLVDADGRDTHDLPAAIAAELARRLGDAGMPLLLRAPNALASLGARLAPATPDAPASLGTRIGAALHEALSPRHPGGGGR